MPLERAVSAALAGGGIIRIGQPPSARPTPPVVARRRAAVRLLAPYVMVSALLVAAPAVLTTALAMWV